MASSPQAISVGCARGAEAPLYLYSSHQNRACDLPEVAGEAERRGAVSMRTAKL